MRVLAIGAIPTANRIVGLHGPAKRTRPHAIGDPDGHDPSEAVRPSSRRSAKVGATFRSCSAPGRRLTASRFLDTSGP